MYSVVVFLTICVRSKNEPCCSWVDIVRIDVVGLSGTSLECSLPCEQHPAKPHYPKPYEAILHTHYVFPEDSLLILISVRTWRFEVTIYLLFCRLVCCMNVSFLLAFYDLSRAFCFIWWHNNIFWKNRKCGIFHYTVFFATPPPLPYPFLTCHR